VSKILLLIIASIPVHRRSPSLQLPRILSKGIDILEITADNRGQVTHKGSSLAAPRLSHLRFSGDNMHRLLRNLWLEQDGQDIAEYAVMLAVILVIVVGTIRLIGTQSNTVFSNVASSIQ
jgi:Flp pilus assembly pilin Flp